MTLDLKRRFIQNIVTNYSHGGFNPYLGTFSAELVSHLSGISTFRYKVPPSLCYRDQEGKEYLSTSATLALFDEFSSLSTILSDRSNRGGVSVILSAENYLNTLPNSEVLVVSKTLKIGKTLGFSDIQMFDMNNNLMASGNHIKYLDAGKLWDFFMSPTIFPYVVNILDSSFMKDLLLRLKIYPPPEISACDINVIGSLYKLFQLESQEKDVSSSYSMSVQPRFMNPNKTFHGGAVAMSIEECVRLSNQDYVQRGSRIRSMNVQYLTPMTGKVNILVRSRDSPVPSPSPFSSHSSSSSSRQSEGEVVKTSNNGSMMCAKYSCTWS